jgi:hypothetical protein
MTKTDKKISTADRANAANRTFSVVLRQPPALEGLEERFAQIFRRANTGDAIRKALDDNALMALQKNCP